MTATPARPAGGAREAAARLTEDCWCPNRSDGRRHDFLPGGGEGLCGDLPTPGARLTEDERKALLHAWPWPQEAATTRDGFEDVVVAVERILAARADREGEATR